LRRSYDDSSVVSVAFSRTAWCAVRMSARDYERLGILAVKSDVSRQQLLKDALEQFLAGKAKDCGSAAVFVTLLMLGGAWIALAGPTLWALLTR
jgi:hypothetical protein